MAASKIILATDNSPVREVIRPGIDALLAAADNPDDWLRLANKVLDDPAAHAVLGSSARSRILECYDRDVTLPRLAERLNQLVGLGG